VDVGSALTRARGVEPGHVVALERLLRVAPLGARSSVLADWLYAHYFIGWALTAAPPAVEPAGDAHFVAELVARGAGATTWEPRWVVTRERTGATWASHGRLRMWIADPRRELRPAGARQGEVSVRMPCVREAALSGFVSAIARAGGPEEAAPHLKLYVHATPTGALGLFEGLLQAPSLRRARFQAKTLNHPAHFGRRDTLLVYVHPPHAGAVARWLRGVAARRPAWLEPELPPMTLPLCRGVGLAESPLDTDESFGSHRTRLVAEGLVAARAERRPWQESVAERFEREGLDWARPWRRFLDAEQ
jgi:hypothetical protein